MRFDRLRECIVALRESPAPTGFTMKRYFWTCGTPACVLGHHETRYKHGFWPFAPENVDIGTWASSVASEEYFGITPGQWAKLFGSRGCGEAKTTQEAIAYIEAFIQRHEPKPVQRTDSELVADLMARVCGERIPEDVEA